jgi:hypothetical protein
VSTHCLIGVGTPECFVATYNHSDGYPAGVGKALWACYCDEYYGNLKQMLAMLGTHMAGWSSFIHRVCYCHTLERGDQPMCITNQDGPGGCAWAYLLDADRQCMHILRRVANVDRESQDGGSDTQQMCWEQHAIVDLRGQEPDWDAL